MSQINATISTPETAVPSPNPLAGTFPWQAYAWVLERHSEPATGAHRPDPLAGLPRVLRKQLAPEPGDAPDYFAIESELEDRLCRRPGRGY